MPALIRSYAQLISGVNRYLFYLAVTLMLIIVPSMMVEVISRYFFGQPTVWGMELAVLLFGPYFLLGGPHLLHIGGHVNLDLLHARMSPGMARRVEMFHQVVILFFCTTILIYAVPLVVQSIEYRETTFSSWNPPLWPFKIAVPAVMLLMGLQSLAELGLIYLRVPGEENK